MTRLTQLIVAAGLAATATLSHAALTATIRRLPSCRP